MCRNFVSESFHVVSHEFRHIVYTRRATVEKIFPQKVTGRYPVSIERQVDLFARSLYTPSIPISEICERTTALTEGREGLENRLIYAKVPLERRFFFPPEQVDQPIGVVYPY